MTTSIMCGCGFELDMSLNVAWTYHAHDAGWRCRRSPRDDGQQISLLVEGREVASDDRRRWWCPTCVVQANRCVFAGRQASMSAWRPSDDFAGGGE